MEKPAQFLQEIRCPKCPQQGHATWEASIEKGGLRHLASLSEGFHSLRAEPELDPAIICNRCGAIQVDQRAVGG
jgi:hypothetical protein